jgi:release factor glutamine methyltransferase
LENAKRLKILDVGTGSGCIIVSLAKRTRPKQSFQFFASDVSLSALTVAKKNAKKHRVKVTFKRSDLLSGWKTQNFDVIIANLPYGWKAWKNNSSAETQGLRYEPKNALIAEDQGLALIKKLVDQIAGQKKRPILVALEFDPRQIKRIKNLASKLPGFRTEVLSDLSGKPRFAFLVRKSS